MGSGTAAWQMWSRTNVCSLNERRCRSECDTALPVFIFVLKASQQSCVEVPAVFLQRGFSGRRILADKPAVSVCVYVCRIWIVHILFGFVDLCCHSSVIHLFCVGCVTSLYVCDRKRSSLSLRRLDPGNCQRFSARRGRLHHRVFQRWGEEPHKAQAGCTVWGTQTNSDSSA